MTFITRFAPSPTGPLHLGHAYSALLASDMAAAAGGTFLLRIEDIDRTRARDSWERQIYDDLHWLGLRWPEPVMRQSDQGKRYRTALARLWDDGLLYPCTCSRRDIQAAASAPQEGAPTYGPDGLVYPGTCRGGPHGGGALPDGVLRLDMARALGRIGDMTAVEFAETGDGMRGTIRPDAAALMAEVGDIVVARRDMGTSYHLSVVLDDADQGITHVVRGQDLFEATAIHVVLQRLLGLPTPSYHHHRLIRDAEGKRLAKRDDARAIALYRDEGMTPQGIRDRVGLPPAPMDMPI